MSTDFKYNFISDNQYFSQQMNYFSFLFPIQKQKKSLGFHLTPLYRINSNIIEKEFSYNTEGEDPLAYKSEYNFSGGPSSFSILFSSKISNHLSLGFKLNAIFGSLYSYGEHKIYDIDYYMDGEVYYTENSIDRYTVIKNYDGYGADFELSYHDYRNRLVASFNINNETNVNEYFYDDIVPESLELGFDYDEEINYTISSPFEFNIGFSRLMNKENTLTLEYYFYKPSDPNYNYNILGNSDLTKHRLSIGYYQNILNDKLTFSSGLYNIISNNNMLESNQYGITFGLGINYIKYVSANICLEVGRNEMKTTELLKENYINLYLGLSTSDKWFK